MAYAQGKGLNKKGQTIFRVYYEGPKKPDGTRNQKKETIHVDLPVRKMKPEELEKWIETKGREKALDYAKAKETEVNKPSYIEPTGETFKELSERWLEYRAGGSRNGKKQPKTMLRYKELLERINEYLGPLEVARINIDRIEEFYDWLAQQKKKPGKRKKPSEKEPGNLSKQTLWHHHRCLYSALEYAVSRKLLESNPAKYVRPEAPEGQDEKKVDAYNAEQVQQIKELVENESLQHKVLVILALETGARAGEILALKWDDINFETRMLAISKAWQYVPGQGCFEKPPKNKSSIRDVRLSASLIFLLRQLKGEQEAKAEERGDKWKDSGALFTAWNGSQVNAVWASCWWRKWIRGTNLPVKTFHSLRHTCISLLMSAGANPLEVARMVGHSNAEMLWRVYGHATQKESFGGADIMAEIMNRKPQAQEVKKGS